MLYCVLLRYDADFSRMYSTTVGSVAVIFLRHKRVRMWNLPPWFGLKQKALINCETKLRGREIFTPYPIHWFACPLLYWMYDVMYRNI